MSLLPPMKLKLSYSAQFYSSTWADAINQLFMFLLNG